LHVLRPNGTPAPSNAFMLPQWGGIIISNPSSPSASLESHAAHPHHYLSLANLSHPFTLFRSQLHSLLGVPPLPSGITHNNHNNLLSPWQLDALVRRRAIENTKGSVEALESIINLVRSIPNMPVRRDVRGDVIGALDALDSIFDENAPLTSSEKLTHSSTSVTLSSRAFFNPGMVAMLYFPAEHKLAVYTPLFAPVSVPVLIATIKEVMVWLRERRKLKIE